MPIGLNVDNPQSQVSEPIATTSTGGITFGGNVIGSGSSSASADSSSFSTILLYGAIALVIIFILKKLGS
jgi:hypothetical protein